MGIVWEAYHNEVPLLGVPGITLDLNGMGLAFRVIHFSAFEFAWILEKGLPEGVEIGCDTTELKHDALCVDRIQIWSKWVFYNLIYSTKNWMGPYQRTPKLQSSC